jgi:hypothetical protein
LAVIILAVLSVTVFFKIKTLKIDGSSIYNVSEITEAAGVLSGKSLLLLDRAGLRGRILDSFIYIDNAEVEIKFPSTVEIKITPSIAAASVRSGEKWLLITKAGKTLELSNEPKAGTVVINGAGALGILPGTAFDLEDDTRENLVLALSEKGFGILSDKLTSVDITDAANVTFIYDNRLEVNVGTYSDMDYKIKFLQSVIKNDIGPNTSGRLTFLPDGSLQFLDSNSIEQNNVIYEQNLATYVATTNSETSTPAS